MNPTAILRALLLAALFGVAVLLLTGFLTRLGGKAGSAVRAAV